MINQNKEDYLRAIYHFWEKEKSIVRSVDIARYLDVSKASVSEMMNKLTKEKLISKQAYGGVSFTKKGLKHAETMTRKHRVIEVFLKDVLGFTDSKVHAEAHSLEHAFSDYGIDRLNAYLKKPAACPGGKKIPKN